MADGRVTLTFRPPISLKVRQLLSAAMTQYLQDHQSLAGDPDCEEGEDLAKIMQQPSRRCL